jgi:hypothetical protein
MTTQFPFCSQSGFGKEAFQKTQMLANRRCGPAGLSLANEFWKSGRSLLEAQTN